MTAGALLSKFRRQLLLASALFLLVSCGGDNRFSDSGIVGPSDRSRPEVRILEPEPGHRIAVGDSILVRLDAADDVGVDSLYLTGFSLRGSADLGTQTRVVRFETKSVGLAADAGGAPRDTSIVRYLIASPDTVAEDSIFLVARAVDVAGNEAADTVLIGIGGPRVAIEGPPSGGEVRAGGDLRVHLTAADPLHRLVALRLTASGGFEEEVVLDFEPARAELDTVLVLPVPEGAEEGEVVLRAAARNTLNDSTSTAAVALRLQPAEADVQAPRVRYSIDLASRSEQFDSVAVTVVATDDTRLDLLGATIVPVHLIGGGAHPLRSRSPIAWGDSATFRVALSDLGVPVPADTSTLRLEVTAFAIDGVGNCATATVPDLMLSEECAPGDPITGLRAGARFETLLVRGRTIRLPRAGDRIADLAADDSHLFLSNITRNRLEVLPLGGTAFSGTVAVGSRPWGLAFDHSRERLYVANSGGTNISIVSPGVMREVDRILTPNVKLFDVTLSPGEVADSAGLGDVTRLYVSSVASHDFSDRPQYIGVTRNENLIYSTLPTAAASDGTLRMLDRAADRLEIITDYAEERVGSKVVIVNADSAFLVTASPDNLLQVCPRDRSVDPSLDGRLGKRCFTDTVEAVQDSVDRYGYDTRFLYSMNIEEIGLTDTTFVAVSGDHRSVAFGEGARANARVMLFGDADASGGSPLTKHGEIRDLVGNAAERVIGLGLNADGSLGVARGDETYFFSRDLRLQGEVETDAGGGGVDMYPGDPSRQRAFVSGVQRDGLAYIDVMDTFHFARVTRIFLRDPVTGPLRAVHAPGGSLLIYAVTPRGLIALPVHSEDL